MSKKLTKSMRYKIADSIAHKATMAMREEICAKIAGASKRFNAEFITPYVESLKNLPSYLTSKINPGLSAQMMVRRKSDPRDYLWAEIITDESGFYIPGRPDLHLSDDLFDDFHAIAQMENQKRKLFEELRRELLANMESIYTTKRLVELWPETAEYVGEQEDGAHVEIPLSAIISRHCGLAIAAPVAA